MAEPFDLDSGRLVFPIADQGAEPGEVKDEPKEDVFNQVHDAGPQDILKADVEVLSIDALEKGGDGEDGAVQGEEQIEPEDKLPVQRPCDGGGEGNGQAHHLDNRGVQLIEQILLPN